MMGFLILYVAHDSGREESAIGTAGRSPKFAAGGPGEIYLTRMGTFAVAVWPLAVALIVTV
jgi:hypothetical protein